MSIAFYNGNFIPEKEINIGAANRGFRFADGCFETIRVAQGYPVFWNQHCARLSETLEFLGIECNAADQSLLANVKALLDINGIRDCATLRIYVHREDGGAYTPLTNRGVILMTLEAEPYSEHVYAQPKRGKRGVVFDEVMLPTGPLGNFKTLNKTLQVVAAGRLRKLGWDDAILMNTKRQPAEAVSSNVYFVFNDRISTPDLSSGCLNGTLRRVITQSAGSWPLPVFVENLRLEEAIECSEIWLSNARTGIQWFDELQGKSYGHDLALHMQRALEEIALNSIRGLQEIQP